MNGMLFMSLVLLVIAVVGFTYFKVQDYIEQKKELKEGRFNVLPLTVPIFQRPHANMSFEVFAKERHIGEV